MQTYTQVDGRWDSRRDAITLLVLTGCIIIISCARTAACPATRGPEHVNILVRRAVKLLRAQGTLPMYHQVGLATTQSLSGGIQSHVACAPCVQILFGTGKPIGVSLATAQGHKYNIPVAVWLPERYPSQAPQLFVEPTPDMMISTNHAFVDASGGVRSSYIASWDASRWGFQACNGGTVISLKVARWSAWP